MNQPYQSHPATGCPSFSSEAAARAYARRFGNVYTTIIHAPHKDNKSTVDGQSLDYFVGGDAGMIRYWETMVYEGEGRKA